ncbi:MAG: glucoamylase family protein, partial [Rubrivivax sp.]
DVARETWRFYERHVGPADHHLPPDNVQMTPQPMVAHRTSPTNIGLYLTATACAQELGFIGRVELAERVGATLDTLERLPRWHGHFFNWLDTRSLAVLQPAYVSTVDSGNLSGHLLALASACAEAGERTAPDGGAGAASALAASAERLHSLQPVLSAAPSLRALARLAAASLPPAAGVDLGAVQSLVDEARAELDALGLGRGAGDDSGPLWRLHDHVSTLASQLRDRAADADALSRQLHALAARARRVALAPDYARLYDRQRRLLHIGLRADTGQLDEAHYDLLASEARLTSLVGIAKGDLPAEHWAALGRPFFACGTEVGLKSWSGSMFEYLMPSLLLDEPRGSVLGQAVRSAVSEQRDEARSRDTPWGISESAIASQDHTLAYQYGPQGAARLALRRTPPDERVLAPYASALAGLVAPAAAVANLQALQALGARRTFGFIEALDYTPTRQVDGRTFTAVHTYMAHHQAMSLVAATDLLTDGVPRRWALADPHLRAVASLLHERPPREVPRLADPPRLPPPSRPTRAHLLLDQVPLADTLPATLLLGHGDQGLWIRSHGGGVSRWQANTITRWRDDLPRDEHGSFIYLRRDANAPWHSITAHPAPDPEARYHARLLTDRALFEARWDDLHARSTVWLCPEDGTELRRVELSSAADAPLHIELAFAAEVTLAPPAGDETHPAFSNLFVRARWDAAHQALYLQRRPRLPDEQALWAVFFVAGRDGEDDTTLAPLDVTPCVDRARWQGRLAGSFAPHGDGGYAALPAPGPQTDGIDDIDDGDGAPGVPLDTGFDPVAVLRVRLRLDAGMRSALTLGVVAGRSPIELAAAVDKYRQATHVRRASDLSHTMAGVRLREMPVDAEQWRALLRLQTLLSATTMRDLPAPADHAGAAWRCERRLLWRFGLSGERAMVLVHIDDEAGLPLVQLLKRALRLWSAAGLGVDLVVINGEPASYLLPVQRQLQMLRERQQAQVEPQWSDTQRGQFVLLAQAELGQVERETLTLLARVRLTADGRTLAQQLERLLADWQPDAAAATPPAEASMRTEAEPEPQTTAAPARLRRLTVPRLALGAQARTAPAGRFDAADGRFVADIDTARAPSRPWFNVLAN